MSRKARERRQKARQRKAVSTGSGQDTRDRSASSGKARNEGPRSLNRAGFVVAVTAIAGLFALVLFLGPGEAPPPDAEPIRLLEPDAEPAAATALEAWQGEPERDIPVTARDFRRGPEDATVEIIEFSDFECPFCRIATRSLDQLLETYPEDVTLVFKNFPLDNSCNLDMAQQLHANACRSAVMARCAGQDDPEKFWRFHDAVFASESLSDEFLDAVAADVGASGEAFDACVAGTEAMSDVRADIDVALGLKLTATPTLYVNGRYAASYRPEDLGEIIDHILATN